ncbi:hypothetical protein AJ79_02632 [Helicocarpus griseus UAMH5409]|uniref:PH domain-containing protein n=1 Tax=Helicocarpus griseus UAMH5409 TaxID=1447875 RepID=A0A2B7Y0W4_9EURO|nr:hypothetical protein AJ79_02632 [Helicocarpus griseus UAMH5409]
MATRPRTPSHDIHTTTPNTTSESPHRNLVNGSASGDSRPASYIASSSIAPTDFQVRGRPVHTSAPAQPSRLLEEISQSSRRGSSVLDGATPGELQRSESRASVALSMLSSRASGTLKKKPSLGKKGSLRRSGSRRSSRAGSVRTIALGEKEKYGLVEGDELNSAFYVPIPTKSDPTEVLAERFHAWRKVLKDLIVVFREVQKSYEIRSKTLLSISNSINNVVIPPVFLASGGVGDATKILKEHHRQAMIESAKAREIETEVIRQMSSLRADLQQKIKEIHRLSGDFKNSVDKEVEGTRRAVRHLQEALGLVDTDPAATSGKGDPFLVKCAVQKQLDKQMQEENYLHNAYLNLEFSGRELERIVVAEIQKSYNLYANILKHNADISYETAGQLTEGPVSLPPDHEWNAFVTQNDSMVDPQLPVRDIQYITYPGKDHPAAAEVRAGMLERKSKYLKSYTPGWYVLSPTHLHEYKYADRIEYQTPVMSLYLPEQKLGTHSQAGSSSHKFMLKGRQTGSMHRGHAWVFRAESHDTMLEWYNDIKNLTEKTGEARNAFVRKHVRTLSGGLNRAGSVSSDGAMDEDEADETPYTADHVVPTQTPPAVVEAQWQRPQPGGHFPSDVQLNRHSHLPYASPRKSAEYRDSLTPTGAYPEQAKNQPGDLPDGTHGDVAGDIERPALVERHDSNYKEWMAPVAATAALAASQTNPHPLQPQTNASTVSSEQEFLSPANEGRGGSRPATLNSSQSSADNRTSAAATTVASTINNVPSSSDKLGDVSPITTPTTTAGGSPNTMRTSSEKVRRLPTMISEFKLPGQYPSASC